jgi:hypothetical protein
VIKPGRYTVYVGNSADHTPHAVPFTVGETPEDVGRPSRDRLLPVALVEDVEVVDGEDVGLAESPAGRMPGGALVTVVMCWCSF